MNWPLQTELNLTLSNFAFCSSWLQRQRAVRPPISIGMVRHVPLAPSMGQRTEGKTNCSEKQDTECQERWPGYDWSNNTSMEPYME